MTMTHDLTHDCITEVERYIRQHLDEPLPRERLAAIGGFSVPHMHRLFVQAKGESIAGCVRRLRLQKAGWQLRMGAVDIMAVALGAGYTSHAAFSKAFKQQFGVSPREFRQLDCTAATQLLRKVYRP